MRVLLVLFVIFGLSGPANAFSDADRTAIQGTIEQQLQAFLRDDGPTAYSFAAPNIKTMYPTVDAFMAMVRQGYPQVYRPRDYSFGELTEEPGYLKQSVEIVDADGTFWTAVYTMRQDADGSWKITGCYIIKKPGEVA
ncbi:MAG: DUF4864 domain-containing protein [Gammaproteobacteria bacterium]